MGKILSITGYADTGRHSLVRRLINEHPGAVLIKSVTTKEPSGSDIPGMYEYITEARFTLLEWTGLLLWGVMYKGLRDHERRYGTLRETSEEIDKVLETPGAIGITMLKPESVVRLREHLKRKGKEGEHIPLFLVAPPDHIHLRRMKSRDVSAKSMARALHKAKEWEIAARLAKEENKVPYHFVPYDGRISVTAKAVNAFLV